MHYDSIIYSPNNFRISIKSQYQKYQLLERNLFWNQKLDKYSISLPINSSDGYYCLPKFKLFNEKYLNENADIQNICQGIQYILEVLHLEKLNLNILHPEDLVIYQQKIYLRHFYWVTTTKNTHPINYWKPELNTAHIIPNTISNRCLFQKMFQSLKLTQNLLKSLELPNIVAIISIANLKSWKDIKNTCLSLIKFYQDRIHFIFSIVEELFTTSQLQFLRHSISETTNSLLIKIIKIPNKGMDIGGFLRCFQELLRHNSNYTYFIKIHSKSDSSWRQELLEPFSRKNIKNTHLKILKNPEIAIITTYRWNYHLGYFGDILNKSYILEICKDLNIDIQEIYKHLPYTLINWKKYMELYNINLSDNKNLEYEMHQNYLHTGIYKKYQITLKAQYFFLPKFVAGTIFMGKFSIFQKFFKHNRIDSIYQKLESGYTTNNSNTYTHSWERILGLIAHFNNMQVANFQNQ